MGEDEMETGKLDKEEMGRKKVKKKGCEERK